MGRLPVIQNDTGHEKVGRDHNTYGFSMWVAGGGFKGGYAHGETDEFGHKAVKDIVNHTTTTPRCCTCSASIRRNSSTNDRRRNTPSRTIRPVE